MKHYLVAHEVLRDYMQHFREYLLSLCCPMFKYYAFTCM